MSERSESGNIDVNGVRLHYKQAGENIAGNSSMMFVHGLGFSKENMDPLFNYYKTLHHVVSYDVRGHGKSDKPQAWTLEDDADDLHALVEALGLEKPVGVGFSMGSYVVLATAEKYPDLFSKIVLIGTKGGGSSSVQAVASSGKPSASGRSAVAERLYAPQDTDEQIAEFGRRFGSPVKLTHEQRDAVYKSLENFDNMANIDKVKIPVLCLTGQHDGINPPAEGAKVAAALPDGRFYEVPSAGHITFFENFDYTVERIDEFLQH